MKLDQDEKQTVSEAGSRHAARGVTSRRNFLHKSSAAVLVTSLAAQPVWGRCTVSGAMSGGSATQGEDEDPCVVPEVWGQPPAFWAPTSEQGSASLATAFPLVEDTEALQCFIAQVRAQSFFTLPATPTTPAEEVNVDEALANRGIRSELASIWLNAYFGFFMGGMLPDRDPSVPQEWVEHFFSLSLAGGDDWGDAFIFMNVQNDGAQTQWSNLPDGYSCA